jgi:antitoxin component of MazEF toxin-antitoxin module
MIVEVTRVKKHGRSLYLLLTAPILQHTCWHDGDKIVVRPNGDKLVLERVKLESLATIHVAEPMADEM